MSSGFLDWLSCGFQPDLGYNLGNPPVECIPSWPPLSLQNYKDGALHQLAKRRHLMMESDNPEEHISQKTSHWLPVGTFCMSVLAPWACQAILTCGLRMEHTSSLSQVPPGCVLGPGFLLLGARCELTRCKSPKVPLVWHQVPSAPSAKMGPHYRSLN